MNVPGGAAGLQVERTALAWVRTALAGAALATVATRVGDDRVSVRLATALGALVAVPGITACVLRLATLGRSAAPAALRRHAVALLATSVALADGVALALLLR